MPAFPVDRQHRGDSPSEDPGDFATGALLYVADGVISVASPVAVDRTLLSENERAGVLASAAADTEVRRSAVTGSHFGLVAVEEGTEVVEEAALAYGNEVNRQLGANLAVPSPPEPVSPSSSVGEP